MLNIARNAAIDMVRTTEYRTSATVQGLDKDVFRAGSDETRQGLEHIGVDRVLQGMPAEHRKLIDMAYNKAAHNKRSLNGQGRRWAQ